jgi:HD-GYP domain-containing protein (c-di-GMP phosphodiesterase class II)
VPDLVARANGFIVKELAAEGYTEYYGVPLIAKGNVVGVMEIFNRAPLPRDAEWRAFCETLADQAAIAIDNARLFTDLQRSHTDLMLAYDATIEGWSRALELRDQETEGHTERVTEITLRLARAFGIGEEEITHIRRGALLHDIGKISIPDAILLKPGKLTDEEMALMRGHAQRAYEMLLPIEYLRPALDIPYCHHEKWDGTGYPRGLKGEEIPLAARLFAIADVYDALTSDRPYRKAWSRAEALEYIRQQSGTYFEPRVVEVFLQIVGEGG